MLGPVAAGFLLVAIEPAGVYLFDVATFLVAIGAFRLMRPSPPADEENEVSWAAVKDGFRFLKGKRNVQSVFLADLNAMIFGFPMALLPAVALHLAGGVEEAQAHYLGFLYAAPAAGAFIATLLSGRAKDVRRQGRAIMLSIVVWGAAIVVFGLSHVLWLSLLMLAIAGAGDMVSGIFRISIIQAAVEDRYRGTFGGDRHGGVGHRAFARRRRVRRGRDPHDPRDLDRVGRAHHDRRDRRASLVRTGFWRYDARHPRRRRLPREGICAEIPRTARRGSDAGHLDRVLRHAEVLPRPRGDHRGWGARSTRRPSRRR
jgi:hypothetical protein